MKGPRALRERMFRRRLGFELLLACALAIPEVAGAQVYNQPYDGSAGALASQNDTGGTGLFAKAYDNFSLDEATTLTSLTFTGLYFNPSVVGATTAFEIAIYDDMSGQPGGVAWANTIAGDGGESCITVPGTNPVCTYSVPITFAAAKDTVYWLSIVNESALGPQWGWANASGGDGLSYQLFVGNFSQVQGDEAFALFDAREVPEPATWALMLFGFGGVGAALRRQRRKAAAQLV